jgi:hypothetical protein
MPILGLILVVTSSCSRRRREVSKSCSPWNPPSRGQCGECGRDYIPPQPSKATTSLNLQRRNSRDPYANFFPSGTSFLKSGVCMGGKGDILTSEPRTQAIGGESHSRTTSRDSRPNLPVTAYVNLFYVVSLLATRRMRLICKRQAETILSAHKIGRANATS